MPKTAKQTQLITNKLLISTFIRSDGL